MLSFSEGLKLYACNKFVYLCVYMPACCPQSTVSVMKGVLSIPQKTPSYSLGLPC